MTEEDEVKERDRAQEVRTPEIFTTLVERVGGELADFLVS